jgi:hypothetical protein
MERIPDVSARVPEPAQVEVREESGRIVLVRRRFGPVRRRIVRLLGAQPDLTIRLDPLGSRAWRLMDGRRTVAQVKAELERELPGEPDIGPRLGRLLGTLVSHGVLRLG